MAENMVERANEEIRFWKFIKKLAKWSEAHGIKQR